jgi:hypothetical protein
VDISFHPPRDPDERRSVRAMVPWWRRAWAWLSSYPKFVTTLLAITGANTVVHAWFKGLITRKELDVAVAAAVSKATEQTLAEVRGDLAIIKMNTGGLPDWRAKTTEKVVALEKDTATATHRAETAHQRIDQYLTSVRGQR